MKLVVIKDTGLLPNVASYLLPYYAVKTPLFIFDKRADVAFSDTPTLCDVTFCRAIR